MPAPAPRSGRAGRFDWERALRDSDLPTTTKAVCLLLGTYMSADGGDARPSVPTLAKQLGVQERAVYKALAVATEAGWVGAAQRAGRVTTRWATLPDPCPDEQTSDPCPQEQGCTQERGVLSPGTEDPCTTGQTTSPVTKSSPDQQAAAVLIDPENPPSAPSPDATFGRTDWRPEWCEEAATTAVRARLCRDIGEAYGLLEALASDPNTSSPRRLTTRLGVDHAKRLLAVQGKRSTATSRRPPRPQWCGTCNEASRRLEDDADGRDLGKCPTCHPTTAHAA